MADNIVDYIVIDIIDNILNRVIMAVKGFAVNHRLFCKLSHRDFGNIFSASKSISEFFILVLVFTMRRSVTLASILSPHKTV